ncbi:lipopolysaccharide biosynthesis protein [Paenibacillus segetis]|uniref:O-antigen translocase n=1 Tax=Paenibacillus segetis TaxID=1325360 RepID=A0ABQ1YPI2_9BACL|nr:oligosaccharide flippase family protein [Paenibacillus segetis]GGH32194.1 O-antigen translocase [Paenibacillus segetis]
MMLKYLKKFTLDSFFRNVVVLARGTVISQILILLTLPLITRFYNPSEYGVYSMYTSIISIMLMLVSFSYENAITLPREDRVASSILSLSLRICVFVSLLGGIGVYFLANPLSVWTNEPDIKEYFAFFFFSLLFGGIYQILNAWSIRKKYFKQISRTKYTQSISLVSSQLIFSGIGMGPLGLIIGDVIGRLGGLIPQWRLWRKDIDKQSIKVTREEIKESAYRYRRFPMFSTASNLLNSLGIYLPTILLAAFYGPQVAGWFALGQRILGSPMTLITTSVMSVYLSESSQYMLHSPHKMYPLFIKTARNVFLIGVAIVLVMVFIAPSTFSFLFGNEWEKSGQFVRILGFMYLSQFVANSVGTTIDVMERQDLHLYREIIRTTIVLGAILLAKYTGQDAVTAVMYFSTAATLGYIIHFGMSWTAIKKYRYLEEETQEVERGI